MDLLSPRLLSILLVLLSFHGAKSTFSPSGSVPIDCGGQQTFTCTLTGNGPASWTITGLQGITTGGSNGVVAANINARITSAETVAGLTSAITITGFTAADNTGTVQCIDQAAAVEGSATVMIGVPSCPTTVLVSSRSSNFSSATITWDQPTNSPPVTSYDVTCNSSCTAMACTSGSSICRALSVSPCEDYSVTVLPMNSCGSSTGCTENIVAVPSPGPPQCGQVTEDLGNDTCPSFKFEPEDRNVLPLFVVVSYQLVGVPSSAESLNCSYPIDPLMCELVVPMGTYAISLTPQNNCGSPSVCPSFTKEIPADCNVTVETDPDPDPTPTPPVGPFVGGIIGGVAAVAIGVSGYFFIILIMSCTCCSSIGFLALLKCLCCPCCKGKATRLSSKQRIDSESPVTPPAQPPAQPPSDEYADPQAIRDRKERGKEDKDKIQYAAIDFSAGAGSGAGEVKIHQKEEPVIYTTVQHV